MNELDARETFVTVDEARLELAKHGFRNSYVCAGWLSYDGEKVAFIEDDNTVLGGDILDWLGY